jgi:hypothetical protein
LRKYIRTNATQCNALRDRRPGLCCDAADTVGLVAKGEFVELGLQGLVAHRAEFQIDLRFGKK